MTLRRPVLAGLTAGAGTSTLAAALHARELGRIDGGEPAWLDVLACRPDARSLHAALALGTGTPRPRPVLAITAGRPDPAGPGVGELRAQFRAVVAMPDVDGWRGRTALGEAAAVLAQPTDALPEPLREYAAALRLIVAAVLAGGGLRRSSRPPLVIQRTVRSSAWPLRTVAATGPADEPGEPDDDAIEAELTAPTIRGTGIETRARPPLTRDPDG